jgi:tetratricopeptide (TPR) repeat protein
MSEAVRLADGDNQALVRYAEMRLSRGEFEPALNAAQQALDQDPHSADAWALRAKLWQSAGELSKATADFHQSLSFEPNRRDALAGLAEIYRTKNEPQRALANLQALADSYTPGQIPREVLQQEAEALLALRRPADAAERYAMACRCGQPSMPLWLATADCQYRAGYQQQARATLEEAKGLWPGAPEVAELVARLQIDAPRLTARP